MYKLNEKICNLEPYDPITGQMKIRLDANESFVNLPEDIMAEIHSAIDNISFNRYPDPNASAVCKAFADYYGISAENVTAGNGSDELISIIMTAFLMKGQTLVTVAPDFSMYRFYTSISELNCETIEKNSDLTIDVDKLIETAKKENVGAVIFSNPCNPTSKGLDTDDVVRIITSLNCLVVLDEAYMDFWNKSLLGEVCKYDNLIILRTASKAVGAAAIRLGFAVANKTITKALKAVKSPYNVNTVTQEIGRIIFSHKEYLTKTKNYIVTQRESLYNSVAELAQHYPQYFAVVDGCSNFVFVKSPVSKELFDYLLSQGTAIRYMGDYVRITAGTDDENRTVLSQINDFCNKL
ncbi:histidinol-phosphate transaminase [Ruminococcus sp. zg-924]|uniref:pyridoxal phosphate-dependent aminotransferase n=1 Tax=Ruminococcus sp. zg-924 TaxID=2678505 RepID=UPI00210C2C4D|nr:aminotransferase class I/II-fold pyridoxal phosphate-dependent enzyme [Ruminococcus sp. zg-924]MCQ4021874.1 aminotransferase class I/II-fold pyridoxal phosphate-dependent enzyme [Ruminococcus sp. zg-924]